MREEVVFEVKEFIKSNLLVNNSLQSLAKKEIATRRRLQHFSSLRLKDKEKQTVYELILSYAFKSERDCPGSGLRVLQKLANDSSEEDFERYSEIYRTKNDLMTVIDSLQMNSLCTSILKQALCLVGKNTKITIAKTPSRQTYLELIEGHIFYAKSLLNNSTVTLDSARVVCIDGYVETVSEIHHLLEHLSETKQSCLLFCRGLSNDVVHTLKVNNDRGTLSVYPYVVPFDVDNANILVDLAVVSNTDIISSLKGNLISSIDLTQLGMVNKCTLSSDSVGFAYTESPRTVLHIKNLLEKIEERRELEDVLSKRLKCLTSSKLQICLPDDINYYSNSQQLDEGIRVISSIINNKYSPESTSQFYYRACIQSLKNSVTA